MTAFDAAAALLRLLETGGLGAREAQCVTFTGDDATIASPHRLAGAMGVAIAAQAAAAAAIWHERTGRRQSVTVDFQDAADAINPAAFLRQHGYPVSIRFNFQEPGNGFFAARGGRWIYMAHGSPRLRNGLLEILQCGNSKPSITRTVAGWDARELEAVAQSRGLPLVMVRSAEEWAAHEHGRALAGRPVIEIERIGDSPPVPLRGGVARPLGDVRVLENTHILAGPGVGRCLAEQGADALRISPPEASDPINFMIDTGFGKRSAFLDLDAPADIERYRGLATGCDVLVQSLAPGALERRGIGVESLAAGHRGLVYVSISCYGPGPWSRHVGYDPLAQSATGVAVREGGAQSPRVVPTTLLADYLSAYLGAFGALAGLVRRAREGGSFHVRVSLAQTCMWTQGLGLIDPIPPNERRAPPRIGRMESPFGTLDHLLPVAQYGETPAFWALPPQPLGASPARWASAPEPTH